MEYEKQKKSYIRKEIAKLTGFSEQAVNLYTQRMIVPEIENPKGRGTTRRYSKANLLEFLIIKHLKDCGQSLDIISRVIPYFKIAREQKQEWWEEVISGKEAREHVFHVITYDRETKDKPSENTFHLPKAPLKLEDVHGKLYTMEGYLGIEGNSVSLVFNLPYILKRAVELLE